METTKTTEKFQSVHKTFSYTPKSALTNQWSSLAFGIGMVIVPLIYPFGLRIRRAVILSPIIRKSKFPQNPKRSVRFSGKRTKRSVQKRKARNTQKAETKVL